MKRLAIIVTTAVLLLGLVLLGLNDTNIAVADTSVYGIETIIRPHEAGNSSAGGSITITMTTVPDE